MSSRHRKYSCKTASGTQEWIHAIIEFIKPYRFLLDAHVVNFFKDKLWEAVDKEWMDCLRKEPIESLLQIPSGVFHDHWPASLKEFMLKLGSLSLPRELADLKEEFPGIQISSLNSVLAQGMNRKKRHEIEVLAAIVSSVAKEVKCSKVIDVGAGQGYLAQVLSFEHELSVFAIDACSHHGKVTDARAERIKKHYAAKLRKSRSENTELNIPKTVTCQVLSANMLKVLSNSLLVDDKFKKPNLVEESITEQPLEGHDERDLHSSSYVSCNSSLVLAGLHACGDLSVTMLRTFLECEKVKAVISIGCCYNLLSEEGVKEATSLCGFPMSKSAKSAGFALGRTARDLACQSAERWRGLGKVAGLDNFELHAFRAAFQMVLFQYYPEILRKSPTIGRQGKALRRHQQQRILESNLSHEYPGYSSASVSQNVYKDEGAWFSVACTESQNVEKEGSHCDANSLLCDSSYGSSMNGADSSIEKHSLFVKFCQSGLGRLGLHQLKDMDIHRLWEETEPFSGLIGPYWSIRAALGPILETFLLLDRLLYLQEQGNVLEAAMLPIFDPVLSPRNMALIAKKL